MQLLRSRLTQPPKIPEAGDTAIRQSPSVQTRIPVWLWCRNSVPGHPATGVPARSLPHISLHPARMHRTSSQGPPHASRLPAALQLTGTPLSHPTRASQPSTGPRDRGSKPPHPPNLSPTVSYGCGDLQPSKHDFCDISKPDAPCCCARRASWEKALDTAALRPCHPHHRIQNAPPKCPGPPPPTLD